MMHWAKRVLSRLFASAKRPDENGSCKLTASLVVRETMETMRRRNGNG